MVAIIWSWALDPNYGLVNYLLGALGIVGPNWLADPRWALPALIIATLWKYMGYYMVLYIAGLQGIPTIYYEAAKKRILSCLNPRGSRSKSPEFRGQSRTRVGTFRSIV